MSPSPDFTSRSDQPRTPRSKESSSSLLAAFRSLTSSRPKQLSSSPATTAISSPSALDSPSVSAVGPIPELDPLSPPDAVQHAQQILHLDGPDSQRLGTVPGLRALLGDIDAARSLQQRVSAAKAVTALLGQYTGADVLAIWERANPLLEETESKDAMTAAYQLLEACVLHKPLTPVERAFLFEAVSRDTDIHVFEYRFQVLHSISNGGRNISDCGPNFMVFLVGLLDSSYASAAAARKARIVTIEDVSLLKVFNYVLDVIKYNSKTFNETDLNLLIDKVRAISLATTSIADLSKSIEIFDCLTTYSCLPRDKLRSCVELLCGTYAGVGKARDAAWQTVEHLLLSHLANATLGTLALILKEAGAHSNANIIRGACQIMTRALQSDDVPSPQPTQLPKLISAARQSLDTDSVRLETDVMMLLLELCDGADAFATVFNAKMWENIEEILEHCAARITAELPLPDGRTQTKNEDNVLMERQVLRQVVNALTAVAEEVNRDERALVMRLMMRISSHLDDEQATSLVEYYAADCLLYTFSPTWHEDFEALLEGVLRDIKRSLPVRHAALTALCDAYHTGEALETPQVHELLLSVLRCLCLEKDASIIEDLCEVAVSTATTTDNMPLFQSIVQLLREAMDSAVISAGSTVVHSQQPGSSVRFALADDRVRDVLGSAIARTFVRIFLRSINTSAARARSMFELLLDIAGSNEAAGEARLVSMQLLMRLRADTNNSIFVVPNLECEDIAAWICRTADTVNELNRSLENPMIKPNRGEDSVARRTSQHQVSATSTPKMMSRTNSSTNKSPGSSSGRPFRSGQMLWLYPSRESLPEHPPYASSHLLTSRRLDKTQAGSRVELNIGLWLEVLLKILQQEELDWEVYSYVLVHLGAQLRNHALFVDATLQIKHLRSVLVSQLANKSFHEPPSYTGMKKADASICLYQILTMLISYRKHYSKNEEDDIVKMFVAGVGSGERSSEACIHALSISCHELPISLTRVLEGALSKMSQIITQSHLAVHILEFLAGLARLPELFKNFRDEEFRVVFGMCFRYLQDVRDTRSRASERGSAKPSNWQTRPHGMPSSTLVDDLPQYVHALTYHVMTFWFMASKMQDRHKHIPWITKNLAYTGPDGFDVLDEQAQVTVDMMNRVAFSDRDDTAPHADFSVSKDGVTSTKTYLVGSSILTVETAGRSALSQITRRRPSSTSYSTYAPNLVSPPRHQVPINVGLAADAFYHDDYIGVLPEHVFQQLYSPSGFPTSVIHLPDDEAIRRAISSFDRISPLDGHKVGIVYVGEGQTDEKSILSNVMGSADYTYFLQHIGTLCELRDAKFNTQGLDRSETEMDGKFTFAWRDRVTELVFHVITMMPNFDHDAARMYKKRHVGNDFVNIIFNNSGVSWQIDNIPCDFNFVNIVITPEARASFVETRLRGHPESNVTGDSQNDEVGPTQVVDAFANLYYRVTILTKPGIPPISPAFNTKIISGASLPAFVRLIALNASVFSDVWANKDHEDHSTSSWRSRLREIKRLHQRMGSEDAARELHRFGNAQHALPAHSRNANTDTGGDVSRTSVTSGTSEPSSNSSLMNARESVVFRRQSKPNIFGASSDMVNRLSALGSGQSVDMERSSSQGSGKS